MKHNGSVNFQGLGFTLVEMAVVLVIVGLLLAGLLLPISSQIDQRDYARARADLQEIREALIGYAVVNGRLPCPDTDGNGIDDGCANTNASATTGGNLPWVDLGVKGTDSWGSPYQYRVNNAFSTTFTLATSNSASGNGVLRVCTDNTCGATEANNVPAVIYTAGKNGTTQPPVSADELENTTIAGAKFDRNFVSHDFSPTFDDVVVWISANVLFNRMIVAGKLP